MLGLEGAAMSRSYHPLAFTDDVVDAQVRYGSRAALDRLDRTHPGPSSSAPGLDESSARDPLTSDEQEFLSELDGFYLATVSATGWPYVQFRGGPPGFIRTPDEHTIAWADFRGNRQYISMGNLAVEGRAALIFMDYARQARLKVYGWATVHDVHEPGRDRHGLRDTHKARIRPADPASGDSSLAVPGYPGRVERELHVDVIAYDWNCPQ